MVARGRWRGEVAVQMAGYRSIAISAGERLRRCVLVEKEEGGVFGRGGRGGRREGSQRTGPRSAWQLVPVTCTFLSRLHCNWLATLVATRGDLLIGTHK